MWQNVLILDAWNYAHTLGMRLPSTYPKQRTDCSSLSLSNVFLQAIATTLEIRFSWPLAQIDTRRIANGAQSVTPPEND